MKHAARSLPALLLTGAVCLGAVFLPSRLASYWDEQRWLHSVYSADTSQSNVSYSYALTTAERIDLLTEYMRIEESSDLSGSVNVLSGLTPSEDEISADQALSICLEEAKELTQLELLPAIDWDMVLSQTASLDRSSSRQNYVEYVRLVDWDDPQRKLSLWTISIQLSYVVVSYQGEAEEALTLDQFSCIMDAETGKLYFVACFSTMDGGETTTDPDDSFRALALLASDAWADYLGVTAPETEPYDPPEFSEEALVQMQRMTFSQEDPSFEYFLYFYHSSYYNTSRSVDQTWTHIVYTPIWPA